MNRIVDGIVWVLDLLSALASMPEELVHELKRVIIEVGGDLGAGM